MHDGAVYVHQGDSYVVRSLDLDDSIALVDPAQPDYTTSARELTDISILSSDRSARRSVLLRCTSARLR